MNDTTATLATPIRIPAPQATPTIVLLATLSLAAYGGTQIPQHNGYKANAKPWKKFKTLKFDEKGEAKADGDLSYANYRRAAWYAVDTLDDTAYRMFTRQGKKRGYRLRRVSAFNTHEGVRYAAAWEQLAGPDWHSRPLPKPVPERDQGRQSAGRQTLAARHDTPGDTEAPRPGES